jgi:putative DNA primase/helicase
VSNVTGAYIEGEDAFTNWIEEWGELDANHWESTAALFANWKTYCEKTGEYVGTMKRISQTLEQRGIAYGIVFQRYNKGRGFRGLKPIGDAYYYKR